MNPTPTSKKRSLLVGLLCVLLLTAVIFRLFWIQTIKASELRQRAEKSWQVNRVIEPVRGSILDRSGEVQLAGSVDKYVIAADLNRLENPQKAARQLSPLLNIPEKQLLKDLTRKDVRQVELRKKGDYKVSREVTDKIMKLDLKGIYPIKTPGRQYNEGKLAAHVLGFVNMAGKAVGGVEQQYDKILRGQRGEISFKKDGQGMQAPNSAEEYRPPKDGRDLVLTLDANIQYHVEKVLDEVSARYDSEGATAIVADPDSGEILAMASRPTFNPAQYSATYEAGKNNINRAIRTQYEPGSTFKIVTVAAAIEEGVFDADAKFPSGSIRVGGRVLRDWNEQGWGEITYAKGVYLSSNVAFVRLAQELGADVLTRYIDRFGFGRITESHGRQTGIDLPLEENGVFYNHAPLHPTELATAAFGQGIAVTPIQQVMAVSAIANGGTLYRPYVVKEIRDPRNGKTLKQKKPEEIRKEVVSEETARQVRKLLRGVVTKGTGSKADVAGYRVAGKTGTAQKPKEDGSGYATGKYVASFIGFAPADDPEVVVYVALDEPEGSTHGGTVAAPAAGEIIAKTLREMEVPKSEQKKSD
ncbi:MAG: penicillin-binding transpeptidase domain-containing protein [Firmicutes bacterium]|uniref:Stage V sporulation protein D (Sporulation-specific penicillin-binding protein) n=1 Tax=Melghirimyces thermohalophilus TaxID=1236220 RepID=A0A1G6HQZ2_9BACL|nr:penicillin-binding transpeptidase domain-containing protein [Melghirimyces thermohalophilus]MDA8354410.1 penicillin-binding transpeptidase domain-containing protein [Bacillota bacterium]SDB96621.1 stage V sporulation protein D (sporulation-specific penicillin-binding protein) [Melghirimyces thermohalophilus]